MTVRVNIGKNAEMHKLLFPLDQRKLITEETSRNKQISDAVPLITVQYMMCHIQILFRFPIMDWFVHKRPP